MIGFQKKYDEKLASSNLNYEVKDRLSLLISESEKEKLILYLKGSNMVFSKTLALFDGVNYIAPYMIFSDGEWIWPSYFSYYLGKDDLISKDFLFHIRERKYNVTVLTPEQKKEVTTFIERKMLGM